MEYNRKTVNLDALAVGTEAGPVVDESGKTMATI
jgi:hypothetical protein